MASITLSTNSLSYRENSEAIALDAAALFDAAGLLAGNLDGFELSISFEAGGLSSDRLTVGANAAEGVGLDGRIVRLNNTEIATFSGGIGTDPLVIRFNTNAQFAAVQSVLRSLTYVNLSDALPETGERSLSLQLRSAQQTIVASASRSLTATGIDDAAQVYQTLTLYDGSTNLSPSASNAAPNGPWLEFLDLDSVTRGTSTDQPGNGGTTLTTDNAASAGFSNYEAGINPFLRQITLSKVQESFPVLDRSQGYTLSFTADLLSETNREATANKNNDGKDDRAGFSLTLLSEDLKGISLNFFSDRIWAHDDGTTQLDPSLEPDADPPSDFRTLFTQAEGVDFDTTELTQYDVAVKGELYTVFANGNSILSGSLRDYTAFPTASVPFGGGLSIDLPDFNELPSLVFLGDLTPSAGASTKINQISISTPATAPTISVANGSVIDLPQFLLNDPDGNDQAATVVLSVSSGSLSVTGNNDVTVTMDQRGSVLNGTITAINALLNDAQRFSYQPVSGFTGTVPVTVTVLDDAVTPMDFNGDNRSDIVWRNRRTGENLLWLMDGVSYLSTVVLPTVQDLNWTIAGVADFSLDGSPDLLWRNQATGENQIWTLDGGLYQGSSLLPGADATWEIVGTGDFNGDGKADIAWRNSETGDNVAWFLDGLNYVSSAAMASVADLDWQVAGVDDFDRDGQADVLWRNRQTGENIIWLMDGVQFRQDVRLATVSDLDWDVAGTGDYNQDGWVDILWRNYGTGDNVAWLMNGTTYQAAVALPPVADLDWAIGTVEAPSASAPKDFNGDNRSDIVWRNRRTGENLLWLMDGVNYLSTIMLPMVQDLNWTIAGVADFSLDGSPDLLWRNQATGENLIWTLADGVYQSSSLLPGTDVAWEITGIGDFNRDGKADIVWRNSQTGDNVVWFLDGVNYVSSAAIAPVPELDWQMVGADDFDRDGQTDLLWRNRRTGENLVWLMDGVQFRQSVQLATISELDWEIAETGDYNQDGWVDILWRNYGTGDNLAWLMNGTTYQAAVALPPVPEIDWAIA